MKNLFLETGWFQEIISRNEAIKTFCLAIRSLKRSVKISTTNKSIEIHTVKQ